MIGTIRHRIRLVSAICLLLMVPAALGGCTGWNVDPAPKPTGETPIARAQVWQGGTAHELRNARVTSDSIIGTVPIAGVPPVRAFALDEIDSLRVQQVHSGRSMGVGLLAVAAVAGGILLYLASKIST